MLPRWVCKPAVALPVDPTIRKRPVEHDFAHANRPDRLNGQALDLGRACTSAKRAENGWDILFNVWNKKQGCAPTSWRFSD